MPYGLYISAEGAMAQSKRVETITNNLANVDTPGFKRDLALFQARYAEAIQRGEDEPGSGSINDIGGGVLVRGVETDFSAAPVKQTGINTDMAIDGDGFFLVRKGDREYLTRAGNFRLTASGELVTQEGYAVLDEGRSPVMVDPLNGPWQVTAGGGIQQGGSVNNLALVKPQSYGDLVKVGENLFSPLAEVQPVEPGQRRVLSGHVEQSSVRPTLEMMELIEASRAFEANTNLIKTQDQMLGALINRVLKA